MSFNRIADGNVAMSADVDQILDALQGVSSKGQPVSLVALSDAINYALSVKNIDAANSRAAIFYGADGNPLLSADKNGVQASAYGANALAPVVTTTQAQTLSNKTLSGTVGVSAATLGALVNGALQSAAAAMGTDTTLPANTPVNTLATVSLAAGTWLLIGNALINCPTAGTSPTAYLRDNTAGAVIKAGQATCSTAAGAISIAVLALYSPTVVSTIAIGAQSPTNASTAKASDSNVGFNGTYIEALRIG